MNHTHSIQCRCGTVRGALSEPEDALREICYCRDCQTYAYALGEAEKVLDHNGGTGIVATVQERVAITHGREHLACMSLTERGLYRWYAACCRTPLANTTRRPQMSYVGLVHSCLSPTPNGVAERWPAYFTVNTSHAKGAVESPGAKALFGSLAIARMVLSARFRGSWRRSPFFASGTSQPVCSPLVLSLEQLQSARSAV
jgi:hypothetical protein